MDRTLRAALAASLAAVAVPASAQLKAWEEMGEEALHAEGAPAFHAAAKELLAPCDGAGNLRLPKRYYQDYRLTPRDEKALGRGLATAKRYANIATALEDGYLPSAGGYQPGLGLPLMHPKLLLDNRFDLGKPDVLTYIKKRGQPKYRLVGLTYVAGKSRPKDMKDVDFDEGSRLPGATAAARTDSWDYEEDVCVIVEAGSAVGTFIGKDVPDDCAGGTRFAKLWRLHAWPLVYNPEGLFHESNPAVDLLDREQRFGPLCPKSAKAAK
ncbi:MAG: hypothetical protein HY554_02625 [Elusimicrobia bacterium]|nr:hypothetical protein [Elusimicrobiota bacterium]